MGRTLSIVLCVLVVILLWFAISALLNCLIIDFKNKKWVKFTTDIIVIVGAIIMAVCDFIYLVDIIRGIV